MKIMNMTRQDVLERMGSEATDIEGECMLELLLASEWDDTDSIPDNEWRTMLDQAIQTAQVRDEKEGAR